jgi:hypothetical protein
MCAKIAKRCRAAHRDLSTQPHLAKDDTTIVDVDIDTDTIGNMMTHLTVASHAKKRPIHTDEQPELCTNTAICSCGSCFLSNHLCKKLKLDP